MMLDLHNSRYTYSDVKQLDPQVFALLRWSPYPSYSWGAVVCDIEYSESFHDRLESAEIRVKVDYHKSEPKGK